DLVAQLPQGAEGSARVRVEGWDRHQACHAYTWQLRSVGDEGRGPIDGHARTAGIAGEVDLDQHVLDDAPLARMPVDRVGQPGPVDAVDEDRAADDVLGL